MKKRGQFTLIVVIAIIVVLALGAFFLFRGNLTETEIKVEDKDSLQLFVESCTNAIAKEAIVKLGEHSGYIDPLDLEFTQELFSDIPQYPTLSDGVRIFGQETFIPYWHHMKSSNTCSLCVFDSEMPTLEEIELQINKYVDENLNTCLQDYGSWTEIKDIKILSEPKTTTSILEGRVNVKVDQPLEITTSSVTRINSFQTDVEVDLKNVYDTADEIMYKFTEETHYLEKLTLLLVAGYSMDDNSKLPPMFGGIDLERNPYITTKIEADSELRSILQDHIGIVSVSGAADNIFPLTNNNLTNALNTLFIPSLDDEFAGIDLESLNIDFMYFDFWPIYLDITGGAGSGIIIQSEMVPLVGLGPLRLPIFIRNMNFVYDVSYPVVIEITDLNAFNGEGYNFKFALEVNIRNNEWNFSAPVNFGDSQVQSTLFCDPGNRKSKEVEIKVKDQNNMPLKASVMYKCGEETCHIGSTDEKGELKEKFPVCAGGEVFADKKNYHSVVEDLATSLDDRNEKEITMYKAKPIKAIVEKRMVRKIPAPSPLDEPTWTQTSNTEDLHIDEIATLVLARQGPSDFVRVVNFKGDLAPVNIELIPGTYNIKGVLMREFGPEKELLKWVIPEDNICSDGICNTVEAMEFEDSLILGGIENFEFTITEDDLENQNIILYVSSININDIQKHIDLTGMSSYTDLISQQPALFEPSYS